MTLFKLKTILPLLAVIVCWCQQSARAQTDEIRLKPAPGQANGRVVRGTISSETPTELRIQVAGKVETLKIEDLQDVTYGGMPSAYVEAEVREKGGDYVAALDGYKRAANASGLRPIVAQMVKFKYAEALALAAGEDEKRAEEARIALQEYVNAYPTSRNAPVALERLLNLVRSGDDQAKIDSVIADLSKIPGAQVRANLLRADLLVDRNKPEEAIALLDSTRPQIKKDSDMEKMAQSIRIKALVGKKELVEAEKQARSLIDQADPNDAASLAPAYNALGDCLRAAGKPKDAMIAYLHTEILYDKVAAEHARALAAITELWRVLEKPDRAEQSLNKLATTYPRSPWLKKVQGRP